MEKRQRREELLLTWWGKESFVWQGTRSFISSVKFSIVWLAALKSELDSIQKGAIKNSHGASTGSCKKVKGTSSIDSYVNRMFIETLTLWSSEAVRLLHVHKLRCLRHL